MGKTATKSRLSISGELRGLIFDVDGTLAETEEVHRHCFNAVFERAGLEDRWDQERYGELLHVTGGKERMRAHFAQSKNRLSSATIASFHQSKNACYAERMKSASPALRPGIDRLIKEAKANGLKLGIATTTSLSNLEALMRCHFGAHWRQDFSAVVCGEMVNRKKPHPEAYTQALKQMQLDPSQAIAFEDSNPGVASARDAGLAVIATPSLYFKEADFSRASLCIDNLGLGLDEQSPPVGIPQLADWFQHQLCTHAEHGA